MLSLSGRTSNNALLCRTPGDWINTKENKKSLGGGTIIRVTSPIRIKETVQCQGSVCKKPNTKGSRAIKITKQTLDCSPMVLRWRVHKLGERNIWVSHPEMLTVHGGIYRCRTNCSSQRSTNDKWGGDRFRVEHVMFSQKINNILLLRK